MLPHQKGACGKADGGILFLDDPSPTSRRSRTAVFLMDKGYFRCMEKPRRKDRQVLIIAATTEDIESSLLNFRRRILKIIEFSPYLLNL